MAGITVKRFDGLYSVVATSIDGRGDYATEQPVSRETAIGSLLALGWHQRDVGDAFYEADPDWVDRT